MKGIFKFKKLRTKILIGFTGVILLVLILSTFNLISTNNTNKELDELMDTELNLLIVYEQLAINMAHRTTMLQNYLLFEQPRYKEQFDQGIDASLALENQALELSDSPELHQLIEKKIEWGMLTDEIFNEYDRGNAEKAMEIMDTQVQALGNELIYGFNDLAEDRETEIQHVGNTIQSNGRTMMVIGIIISGVAILLGSVIAVTTSASITRPIRTVMDRMTSISNGDLNNSPLETTSQDEIGQLVTATNIMNQSMYDIMVKINDVSNTVSTHSEELTQSANEISMGTQQVSVTMEELASGAESQANFTNQLSETIASYTQKADDAKEDGDRIQSESQVVVEMTEEGSQLMNSSMRQMENIDTIVQDAVQKVRGLNDQSQEISNLVVVIQNIADQTNLLALNAAIEAARAGDHGSGFAVVADEVRKLAEQVSHSVTDISSIVDSIQDEINVVTNSLDNGYEEVEQGTEQIRLTGEKFNGIQSSLMNMINGMQAIGQSMEDIAENSQDMNTSIQEIASISEESSAGIEQTSASAQQTSSSMEEIVGSADELAGLAEELHALVNQFKL